ncbi:MAG: hypothetical protein WBL50_23095 [Candidatus Acidiferrum sp.]
MRRYSTILLAWCAALLLVIFGPAAKASNWNEKTILTFNEPVEIPGHVLLPGSYTFSLMNSGEERNIVEIRSTDSQKLVAIVLTDPVVREHTTNHTKITFESHGPDTPKAIQDWFYPGRLTGQQFIYYSLNEKPATSPSGR